MDPTQYIRIIVGNLAIKIPAAARTPKSGGVHPSAAPCYAKIRLSGVGRADGAAHLAAVPLLPPEIDSPAPPTATATSPTSSSSIAAGFHLAAVDIDRLSVKRPAKLKISLYTGRRGTTCGMRSGRLLGEVKMVIDLKSAALADGKVVMFFNGWTDVGDKKRSSSSAQLYLTVRAERESRFVFEFEGEPECSPQVLQVQAAMRQPVFSCEFSCRSSGDWNLRSRSPQSELGGSKSWLSFGSNRERPVKERKGWSVTVHDLTGSPVALASMVTPFVASPGTDRVSRSNPGAWLVLRPGYGTWKPWGRLEAWRERGGAGDGLGYRFELLPDTAMVAGINLAESTISTSKGGKFTIDVSDTAGNPLGRSISPGCSPRGSGNFGFSLWPFSHYRGFVMSSTVSGEGHCSPPAVEVSAHHVACAEDAAAFVALAAAIDLSMVACKLFSHKLRKELSNPSS